MPHSGNFTTRIPGPYPPAHMGGEDIAFAAGDTFRTTVSGQIENRDINHVFKQMIVTRHAIATNGAAFEIEIDDLCLDKQGNLYTPLWDASSPSGSIPSWGGPQIQKFDNKGNDLGRWDQSVFFTTPVTGVSLLPIGICCLKDNTIAVLAQKVLVLGTRTAAIVHLSSTGLLLGQWDVTFVGGNMSTGFPLEVAPDGHTVYYLDTGVVGRTLVHRFDVFAGTQLSDITGVDYNFNNLIVLPDGGVILVARPGSIWFVTRYDSTGVQVWQTQFTSTSPEPGAPDGEGDQGITPDGKYFYLNFAFGTPVLDPITNTNDQMRVAKFSVEDGSLVDYWVPAAIPFNNESSYSMISWNNKAKPAASFGTVIGAT